MLIYDRFDIWETRPDRRAARRSCVTDSVGRRENMTFRIMQARAATKSASIDPAKPLFLSAFDEDTKASGFYATRSMRQRAPEKVVMATCDYGTPTKAKNAETVHGHQEHVRRLPEPVRRTDA